MRRSDEDVSVREVVYSATRGRFAGQLMMGPKLLARCLRNSGTHVHQRPPASMVAELNGFERSWLFAIVHPCSPRVAVTVAVTRLCF
jgi:hypothetical protein